MSIKQFLLPFLLVISFFVSAQTPTVGVISHSAGSKDDGYVLFAPMECDTTYLIDKCGNLVHRWNSHYKPGLAVYLLDDGSLLRAGNILDTSFFEGGRGGILERMDWNGNIMWSYIIADSLICQHHDMKLLPNGNILTLVWVIKNKAQLIAAGANPSLVGKTVLSEQIIELQPIGTNSANIVWTWNLWDHLVQDYDSTKPNYGIVSQNPQLLNLNYNLSTSLDWIHLNAIDYNQSLDQIVISSRSLSEFYILDHSTTSAQAATHTGGIYGKGGDFLYRWGNPAAYNKGVKANQKLFGHHNVQWVTDPNFHTNDLLIFNNGVNRTSSFTTDYSTVEFLTLPGINGIYNQTLPYLPSAQNWIYSDTPHTKFYASYTSGAQLLSNGNLLICNGPAGYFFEIDSLKNKVWEYINPVASPTITTQGNTSNQNNAFRCNFYESSFIGFNGKDLTPGVPLEINPITNVCHLNNLSDIENENAFQIFPNPSSNIISIKTNIAKYTITLYDAQGKALLTAVQANQFNIEKIPDGFYTLKIITADGLLFTKKIMVVK